MKKILILLFIFISLSIININSSFASCTSEYGIMAKDNYDGTCSCTYGYIWGKDLFGKDKCISTSTYCYDNYGVGSSRDSIKKTCQCDKGYIWHKDSLGNYTCGNMSKWCTDNYGVMSFYNMLSDNCECKSGYIIKAYNGINGNSYSCESCYSIYGLNSEYDSINKICGCKDGYTLKDGKCEEKNNSVYYFLAEFNEDKNEVIVISLYDNTKYLLELRYTSSLYKAENFVGKSIVINLGTDFTIDKYDKFILNNRDTTTDIVSDILSVEKVDSDYTLKTCEDVYGSNSVELLNGKCGCKTGYEWSSYNTCILKTDTPIIKTSYTQANQDFNLSVSTKQSVDKVFNSIKLKLLFLPSDTKTKYYNTLSSKIDSIISKQKNKTNINILNYLNSLIKSEVKSINLFLN